MATFARSSLVRIVPLLMAVSTLFSARTVGETVWGAVVWSHHGEIVPSLSDQPIDLTPVGADQLQRAGQLIRNRYVSTAENADKSQLTTNSQIAAINEFEVNNGQLHVSSPDLSWIANSATAFMQGVYPPYTNPVETQKYLTSNGTAQQAPVGNYQYVHVHTPSDNDPLSIYVDGVNNCPEYQVVARQYYQSDEFKAQNGASQTLYRKIQSALLSNILSPNVDEFLYAWEIWQYVQYEYDHNKTVQNLVSSDDLRQLRALASAQQFAFTGNLSASGFTAGDNILAIAGQTAAARVVGLLSSNINSDGHFMKLSAVFSSLEPFLSYFALAKLTLRSPSFYGLPDPGSSMVWELFTSQTAAANASYPLISDLRVRFLFRNGSTNSAPLVQYPLFGGSVDHPDISWTDFLVGSESIMVQKVGDWCDKCGSVTPWCALYGSNSTLLGEILGTGQNGPSGGSAGNNNGSQSKVSTPVAGVIGAVVTLAVIALALTAAILFLGIGFHKRPSRRNSRKSLGGFKGSEKLASDADLPKGFEAGTGAGAAGAIGAASIHERGHERVQSWELGKKRDDVPVRADTEAMGSAGLTPAAGAGFGHHSTRPSDDIDRVNPFGDGVQPHDRV